MAFAGFPRKVRFIPVPSPVFGPLLEQIDDLGELKCTLRVIWLLHEKKGFPRYVTLKELLADRVLAKALAAGSKDAGAEISRSLALAVRRGTLLSARNRRDSVEEQAYVLNTEADRKAMAESLIGGEPGPAEPSGAEPWEAVAERPNIFALYEDHIGMLNPMIAEELKEAEEVYPQSWIEDAFREAVSRNKRSWRYVAAILERWEREGRTDGESRGYLKKAAQQQYLRR